MEIRSLTTCSFEDLMTCFLKSFENYFVELPHDFDFYKKRWKAAKVNFKLSYGMFDKNKLVGFIINGVDTRNGDLIAFNTGTGVLPEYRGQKISKTIYKYALVELAKKEVAKCSLEVIRENTIAISTYKSIGFEIVKNYKSFQGKINLEQTQSFQLKKLNYATIDWAKLEIFQPRYSWDNQTNSIKNKKYQYFEVWNDILLESYFIIDSATNYLIQFETFINQKEIWKRLFTAIQSISDFIKINNVDTFYSDKINLEWLFSPLR